MGTEHDSKTSVFEQLLPRLGLSEEDFVDSDEDESERQTSSKGKQKADDSIEEDESESEEDIDEDTQPSGPPHIKTMPLHRVVFPPFVQLPSPSFEHDSSHSLLLHIPWASGLGGSLEPEGVDGEGEGEDVEALQHEYQDDEQLDGEDSNHDRRCEEVLWREFGVELGKRTRETRGDQRLGRKRRRTVKTTELVPGSDED